MEHFDHTSYDMRQSLICWVCCFVNCAVEEGGILDRAEYTTSTYTTVRPDVASDGRKTTSFEV